MPVYVHVYMYIVCVHVDKIMSIINVPVLAAFFTFAQFILLHIILRYM